MADFIPNLWESVFTPGTTPTLLVATNLAFGALQILLAGLLFATYSIHFAILSVLAGGLWYSINWFANELQQAQAKEAEAERLRKKKRNDSDWKTRGGVADSADDEGEDTEVEGGLKDSTASLTFELTKEDEKTREQIVAAMRASGKAAQGGASSGLRASSEASGARQRRFEAGDKSASDISTDSEWEKVDKAR